MCFHLFNFHCRTNPYTFKNFEVSALSITFNGMTFPSPTRFEPKWTGDEADYTREYLSLFSNLLKIDKGSLIKPGMYKDGGYCFYLFDFGSNVNPYDRDHLVPKR